MAYMQSCRRSTYRNCPVAVSHQHPVWSDGYRQVCLTWAESPVLQRHGVCGLTARTDTGEECVLVLDIQLEKHITGCPVAEAAATVTATV